MVPSSRESPSESLVDQLADLSTSRARASFLRRHTLLWDPAIVEAMYARVVRLARSDLPRAERLAQAATWIAEQLEDDGCRAQSLRATGHVRLIGGHYKESLKFYDAAARLFRRAGRDVDVARTMNGALQSLISLGKYDAALASARKARRIFERHGVALGLARLDSNVANIMGRQDRFDEALALYQRAYVQLAVNGEPQDVAAVLSNMAVCYINLNDFEQALATSDAARTYCERHAMPLLVVRADYNIAYLYYLRGEYTRALDLYRTAQEHSDRVGDAYHSALCDLDRSEMYLELNLGEEAGELAGRALARFSKLGLVYEEAKAVTNLALATSHRGGVGRARQLFADARRLFAREGNDVWLALLDFYEALVVYRDGQHARGRRLAEQARKRFARAAVPARAALCDLLLARLELHAGNLQAAEDACRTVSRKAAEASPILSYQVHFILGLVREARGERDAAFEAFQHAHAALEELRSRLQGDDLKVAFLEDKQAVYESLVSTSLTYRRTGGRLEAAFGYIENAKSRSLADLIAFRAVSLAPRVAGKTSEVVPRLRQELHWNYRQVEQQAIRRDKGSARRMAGLRRQAVVLEKRLSRSLDQLRRTDEEFSALQSGASFGLDDIRSSLAAGAVLLEYYQARGRTYVCVVGRDQLDIVPLRPMAEIRSLLRFLQFQLSKFRLGPGYVGAFAEQLQAATDWHLGELYQALIAPIRDRLTEAAHLVVVPHDVLHAVPFHALFDGERYLIDEFSICYAPSSSVYRLCRTKPDRSSGPALIMGVPDASTPSITDEVLAIASVLPNSQVFLGADATIGQLQRHGERSRFVHIATHGLFRRDNPMFSSIRLGDGPLSVYDLYDLRLPAELVTLSGCGTGLRVVAGGDEQLGLVRGLLYAGARAVLLTLWDAYDSSTADFMTGFYTRLQQGRSKAQAAQEGMRELRERYPHPFYWAPFTLVGNEEAVQLRLVQR